VERLLRRGFAVSRVFDAALLSRVGTGAIGEREEAPPFIVVVAEMNMILASRRACSRNVVQQDICMAYVHFGTLSITSMRASASKNRNEKGRIVLPVVPWPASAWKQIILIEDNSARAQRKLLSGVGPNRVSANVVLRLHKITPNSVLLIGERAYPPGTLVEMGTSRGRAGLAVELLHDMRLRRNEVLIVAGASYGGSNWFLEELTRRGFDWVVELPRKAAACVCASEQVSAIEMLSGATWTSQPLISPATGQHINYAIADLGQVLLSNKKSGRLFAAQNGAIQGLHNGTIFGLTSVRTAQPSQLLRALGWSRWIRLLDRQCERNLPVISLNGTRPKTQIEVRARSNITLSRQQDEQVRRNGGIQQKSDLHGTLRNGADLLNVVELFAGAGGMGLGFLLAGGRSGSYRLTFSGEVHPVYVETLRRNHIEFRNSLKKAQPDLLPESVEPLDLRLRRTQDLVESSTSSRGDTDILIGGPPCQGFSSANRNSWHGDNPHNQLVDVFLKYVQLLQPRVFLMENVQGILWTPRGGKGRRQGPSVVKTIARKMERAGYIVFPKLLDAVWFGVPQYRSRFFLLGIHTDLGYRSEHFGEWGPFPFPTIHGARSGHAAAREAGELRGAVYRKPAHTVLGKQ
jgi:site-specific DNA-cytosine methylase